MTSDDYARALTRSEICGIFYCKASFLFVGIEDLAKTKIRREKDATQDYRRLHSLRRLRG
jgi:hypothetical protein